MFRPHALWLFSAFWFVLGFGAAPVFADGQDGEQSLLEFEADRISVRETGAALSLTIRAPMGVSDTLIFGLVVEPLDGAPTDKLIALDTQLTLTPGENALAVNLLIKDDSLLSGDQAYAIRLYPISLGSNQGVLLAEPVEVRVIDDEAFAPARLVDGQVEEAEGRFNLTLRLDRPAEVLASATIELFPETAKDGQDYIRRRETVFINPGDEAVIFPIEILDDEVFEADERLFARIVQSDALEVVDFDAEILISDNDAPPVLTFTATQAREGQARATVAVVLDRAAGVETAVSYDFRSGSATLGEDFSGVSGTITFPEGATRQFINFDMVDDSRDEADEDFIIAFRDAVGLTTPQPELRVDVLDDDPAPRLRVDLPELREGETRQVRFTLDAPSDRPITFAAQLVAGTAQVPEDIAAAAQTYSFAPGETGPRILDLTPVQDEIYEETETLTLTLAGASNVRLDESMLQLSVFDANAVPQLRLTDARADEGAQDNGLRFTLSEPSSRPSSFTLTLEGVSAQAGEDFVSISDSYSFAAGQTEVFVPLQIIDNLQNEADEALTIALTQPEGLTLAQAAYPITIGDDDAPPALVITGEKQLAENSQTPLVLTLSLSEISGQDISIDLDLAALGQEAGSLSSGDFTPLPPRVTIPAGQRDIELPLQPRDDAFFEPLEEFVLTLTPVGDTLEGVVRTALSLVDNDEPPVLSLTAPPLMEGQNATANAPLFLRLSKPAGLDTVIELGIFEGTAREGQDYRIDASTVTILAGQNSVQIPLQIIDDEVFEGDESFEIALLSSNAALIEENLVEVQIADNDDSPQIALSDTVVAEGDGERGLITFTLTTPSDSQVTFDYELVNGTATLGQDFLTHTGTLEFAPGQVERRLDLQIVDDRTYEQEQTLQLTVTNVSGAEMVDGTSAWEIALADNDPLPRLSVADTEVLEAGDAAAVTLSLDRRAEVPISLSYRLSSEAAEGADIALEPGRLTFDVGETSKSLALQPLQDTIDEDREIFHILLTEPENVRLPETAARITLIDDDPAPNLSIADSSAQEPTSGREALDDGSGDGLLFFTLSLSAPSGRTVTAEVLTTERISAFYAAETGVDFAATGRTVTFEPGVTEVRVPIQLIADGLDEEDEEVGLSILEVENANLIDASAVGIILDSDPAPILRADDLAVLESATSDAITAGQPLPAMRLHLSQVSGKEVYVDYALAPESARVGSDIEPVQGTLIFPAGTLDQFIPLRLLNDNLDEDVETLALVLSNPNGATLENAGTGLAAATLTITDDDLGPELRVVTEPLREGANPDQAVARVALAEASAQPLTLNWQVSAKTATANVDFRPQRGTLTFQPGQTLGLIPIQLLEDEIDEVDEEIELQLTSDQIRISSPTTAIVIEDNDDAPAFRLAPAILDERTNVAQISLTLDAPAERDLPGTLALSEATATLDEDFGLPTREFIIPAGVTSLTIPISLINDKRDEPEERFTLTAQLLVDDAPAPASATYTIADDDAEPTLSLVDLEVTEGGEAAILVEVSEPSGKAITLSYITVAGSALAGEEFEDIRRTVSIPPNTARARLPITLIDDTFDEIAETFTVRLTGASKALIAVDGGIGLVTVLDNDPPVRVTLGGNGPVSAPEDQRLSIPLTLAQPSGHPVELEIETVSGIAVAKEDYEPRIGRVLFEPGQTEAIFTVDLIDDGFEESLETFSVKINSARNAEFDPTPIPVGIVDNDLAAALNVETVRMVESGGSDGGLIKFSLTSESNDVVVIEYDVIDGTAENNVDYALGPGALIFLPGETEKLVSVPLQADGVDEFDETFILSILAANVDTAEDQITIRINDSDPAPELSLTVTSPQESDGQVVVDLQLVGVTQKEVSGNLALTPAAAFSPALEAQTLPFTIPAGERSLRLTVPINDDEFDEFDEPFTLALNDTVNARLPKALYDGVIRNDDPPTALTLVNRTFDEGAPGQVAVEVALDRPSGKPISFDFTLSDMTAVAGQDWQGESSQARIEPGRQSLSIPLTILGDEVYEGAEQFELAVSNIVHAAAEQPRAAYTIAEDEALPRLLIAPIQVTEGQPAVLPVAIDTPSAIPLTLRVSVADGTASLGRDLEPLQPEIRFNPGQTASEILLIPIDDPFDEFDEDLFLTFTSDVIQTPATPLPVTLSDNDEAPVLAVVDIERLEDASGVLDLSLSLASNKPITFTVIAEAGSATLGEDFDFSPQTITLAPGESQVTLPLTLIDDQLDEDVETYELVFSGVENLSLSKDRLTVALIDTDPEPQLDVSDLILEESATGNEAFLDVYLSEPSGRPVTVRLASADAGAIGFADYDPVAQDVVFAPGQTLQRVPISLVDDALFEAAESFLLTLGAVENALAPARDVLVTILDNDPQPALIYADQTLAEAPGDPAFTVPVRLSSAAGQDITVPFTVVGLDPERPDLAVDNLTITFLSGETEGQLTGRVLDDPRDEAEQQIQLNAIFSPNYVTPLDPLTLTIRDDDPAPTMRLETRALTENDAAANDGALIARLSGPSEKPISARLAFANGSARAGEDFVATPQTLTFAPGQTELPIDLELIDDRIFELEETLDLVLTDPSEASVPQPRVRVSLRDDDPQPRLTLASAPLAEGESVEAELRLDAPSSQQVTLTYALTSDTARVGQDFEPQQGTVTFNAGETLKTVRLTALRDEIDETEETALFTFVSVSNARIDAISAPLTVLDRNERPTLILESVPTPEGTPEGGLLFTLSLTHPSASPLAVAYTTQDQTALGGQDYVAAIGELVFEPGQRTQTLRIDLIDDTLFEGDEAFALSVSFVDGPADPQSTLAQISDDETPPQLLVDAAPTSEGEGTMGVILSLDRPTTIPLTFGYETIDGEALAGTDYVSTSGTIQFSPNQRSEIVFIDLIDDALREDWETFSLRLAFEGAASALLPAQDAPLLITDNDPLPLILAESLPIPEDKGGDGTQRVEDYILTLDAPSAQTITLNYTTVFDGEADAADVTPIEGTLTFAPGETEARIRLEIRQDGLAEGDETLSLAFTDVTNARISNPRARITLRETLAPTLTITPAEATEGDDLAFDLTLSPISPRPLYILYGPASASGLPIGRPKSYVFAAGESTARLLVPTEDNGIDEEDRDQLFLVRVADDSPLKLAEDRITSLGIIRDDDPDPVLSIAATRGLAEGREGFLTLRLEGRTAKASAVTLSIGTAGQAQPGVDIEPLNVRLPIQDLGRNTQVPISIIDDPLNESTEGFELRVDGEGVTVLIDEESLTIADNDPLPVLSGERLTLREGDGEAPTLRLSAPSGRDLRLLFSTENREALEGQDFSVREREVVVPAGATAIPLPIDLIDDQTFELTEDFAIAIAAADFMDVSAARIPVRILDNDDAPNLTLDLADANEGTGGTLTLRLDTPSAVDTVVALRVAGGTAQQGRDFDLDDQQIVLPAGATQAVLNIPYLADGIFEGPETFTLELAMIQGASLSQSQLTGRIGDTDVAPAILIADRAVLETTRGDVLIDVQAFGAFENPIELTYTLVGETAQAGEDFVAKTGTLVITPDQPEGLITFRLIDDATPEGTERFTLSLSSTPQVDLPIRPVAIDIIDNEFFTQP